MRIDDGRAVDDGWGRDEHDAGAEDDSRHEVFVCRGKHAGMRLDSYLAELLGEYSRDYIKELILDGLVTVDGRRVKPGRRVKAGQVVEVFVPAPVQAECLPEDIPLRVHYEDGHMIVVEKPRGMLTHPVGRHQSGTLVNALLFICDDLAGICGTIRPGIVHRLDKVTSGLLVVAKTGPAMEALQDLFRTRRVEKRYLAVVEGATMYERGLVDMPIGRHPTQRLKMRVDVEHGRPSQTSYRRLRTYRGCSLLELYLHTGRTHQIRVHMAAIGHPVVGDVLYGARAEPAIPDGIALHSWSLRFIHPFTGEEVECRAPMPLDMRNFIRSRM